MKYEFIIERKNTYNVKDITTSIPIEYYDNIIRLKIKDISEKTNTPIPNYYTPFGGVSAVSPTINTQGLYSYQTVPYTNVNLPDNSFLEEIVNYCSSNNKETIFYNFFSEATLKYIDFYTKNKVECDILYKGILKSKLKYC